MGDSQRCGESRYHTVPKAAVLFGLTFLKHAILSFRDVCIKCGVDVCVAVK